MGSGTWLKMFSTYVIEAFPPAVPVWTTTPSETPKSRTEQQRLVAGEDLGGTGVGVNGCLLGKGDVVDRIGEGCRC